MEKVLNTDINSIILTDEELFIEANNNLEEDEKICYATFKNYKGSKKQEELEVYTRFLALYKKALIKQKRELFKKFEKNE
jgi:hypothetical protein